MLCTVLGFDVSVTNSQRVDIGQRAAQLVDVELCNVNNDLTHHLP